MVGGIEGEGGGIEGEGGGIAEEVRGGGIAEEVGGCIVGEEGWHRRGGGGHCRGGGHPRGKGYRRRGATWQGHIAREAQKVEICFSSLFLWAFLISKHQRLI